MACVAGGSSNILGNRYGKFNSDGSFNYLDGTGTLPENEGGPVMHGQTVSQFGTLFGCSAVNIASSPTGATESGTTVTINTTSNHHFQAGQRVAVSGVKVSGYNGNFTMKSQRPKARRGHNAGFRLTALGSRFESWGKALGLVATVIGITVGVFAIYEHVTSPSLTLELMIPYTGWEVSLKNTGRSIAKQVHVAVVVWRNTGVPAADVRESYRIEDIPPLAAETSLRIEVISHSNDIKYPEENARDSRSGFIVVSCEGCRKPRAWAFYIPGTNEREKERIFFPVRGGRWPDDL